MIDYEQYRDFNTRLELIEQDLRSMTYLRRWLLGVIVTIGLQFIGMVTYIGPKFGEAMAKIEGMAAIHSRIDRVESRIMRNEQYIFGNPGATGPHKHNSIDANLDRQKPD